MAPIPEVVPKSNLRLHKESMLRKMIEKEDQAELSRVRTIPNVNYVCPNAEFYKNEGINYKPTNISKLNLNLFFPQFS